MPPTPPTLDQLPDANQIPLLSDEDIKVSIHFSEE
jgi:hypothetical protein